jgi:hypothetical protein
MANYFVFVFVTKIALLYGPVLLYVTSCMKDCTASANCRKPSHQDSRVIKIQDGSGPHQGLNTAYLPETHYLLVSITHIMLVM